MFRCGGEVWALSVRRIVVTPMAGRPPRVPVLPDVFDIKEPQILEILAEEDEDGNTSVHLILLRRILGPSWLVLDPDLRTRPFNLERTEHVVLKRGGDFPPDIVDGVYAHDAITRVDLDPRLSSSS